MLGSLSDDEVQDLDYEMERVGIGMSRTRSREVRILSFVDVWRTRFSRTFPPQLP
jgi:hypothetical protein